MVIVRFVQHAGSYNPGDVAGFLAQRAEELVAAGVAVVVEPAPAAPEKPNHRAVMPPDRRRR